MNDTYTPAAEIPRVLPGDESRHLATAMYERIIGELATLAPDDWKRPTVCAPWSVADIVRHLIGAAKSHASKRELLRQVRYGFRNKADHDGNALDATNALQVADHAAQTPDQLLAELRAIAPRAVSKRMGLPRALHGVRLPADEGGSTGAGMPDSLRLGHLMTVILTRDVFIHRIDVARATDRNLAVEADTEGRLVADVVAEWADRHGEAFRLDLTGPAGGRYAVGEDGPEIQLDALEFCWVLSGRGPAPHPLLGTRVFF